MKINDYKVSEEFISEKTLTSIIQQFETQDVPTFRYRKNYYDGKQKILNRTMDSGKPNNRIVANFVHAIVENYAGYGIGIPVSYNGDAIEPILDVLQYNDVQDEDTNLYTNALIYGRGVEICYIDGDGESRFTNVPPTECIPVYDTTLEHRLRYAVRIFEVKIAEETLPNYYIDLYDDVNVYHYKSNSNFSDLELLGYQSHYYNQIPVIFMDLNLDIVPIAEQIYGLQDAYNSLISDSINDWDAFCDAYLILKGAIADSEDLKNMKENRCILLDSDSDASFLTKTTNTTEIENLLKTTEQKIWEMSNCVNFKDDSFGTASGVALKYKLLGMENNTSSILNRFKKALIKRIELICSILRIKGNDIWASMDIKFKRNLPTDMAENANVVAQLKGTVSDETLLGLLPFVTNPAEELDRLAAQQESNMELFMFNHTEEEPEVDE